MRLPAAILAFFLLMVPHVYAGEPIPAPASEAAASQPPDPRSWGLDLKEGFARAKAENRFVILVFLSASSPSSERFVRDTLGLSPMVKALEGFVRVRLDSEKDRGYALFYKAEKYPTVIFFDSERRELDRFSGFVDLRTMLHRCLEAVDPKTNYVMLKERLRQDPGDVEALYYMGYKHWRRNDFEKGEEYFKRVEELDPKGEKGFIDNILVRRAELLEQKGSPEEALKLLNEVRSKHPDSDDMEAGDFLHGRLLFQTGNSAAAREAFHAFLERYPESERRFEVEAAYAVFSAPAPPASSPARTP